MVINPLPAYKELKDVASREFLIGAFFPWIFVIVADLTIYEVFVPDGVSLVDDFLALDDNDQLYAAVAILIGIAGLAAASDFVAEQITGWYRQQSWRQQDGAGRDPIEFESDFLRVQAEIDGERAAVINSRIDAIRSDIKRSGIFIIGFGLSIILYGWELRYQPAPFVSASLLFALWLLMTVPFFLINRQFRLLCQYDALLHRWAEESLERRGDDR